MTIPKYETIMLPFLKYLKDKREHSLSEVKEYVYKFFSLNEEEKRRLSPSGRQAIIDNRIGWARTYLGKAGLLQGTKRGFFKITDRGLKVLNENPPEIDVEYLRRFPEFVQFKTVRKKRKVEPQTKITESLDPIEILENSYQKVKSELANELLTQVKQSSPKFFENVFYCSTFRFALSYTRFNLSNSFPV